MVKVFIKLVLVVYLHLIMSSSLFSQINSVKWHNLDQLDILQAKKPRKVIIEIYSKDCEWCKKFESEVLTNPVINSYINQYYYMVKVDVFDKSSLRFKNKELLSTNGFNPLTAEYLKNNTPLSFPTQLFFDEQLNFLNFLKGYNTAPNFEMAITYFGENYYKSTNWNIFIKEFKHKAK
jgi:thioredoxin-related protein